MHPSADGAAIGAASMRDFHLLAAVVARLGGGVYVNLGSAVVLPEVFVKALNLARNLGQPGARPDHRRHGLQPALPARRQRRVAADGGGGTGLRLTGHHEIMFPLLWAAVEDELARRRR
jgi:hypothetical protein